MKKESRWVMQAAFGQLGRLSRPGVHWGGMDGAVVFQQRLRSHHIGGSQSP